jgi:sulfate permease
MLSPLLSHLLIPFLVAIFLAINMGGSGTAPSFSVAYGANVIRRLSIPGLFGICVFAGALIAGKKVSLTMGRNILDPEYLTIVATTIVLLSISLSLFFANLLSVPQSTSQSSVFALLGVAVYFGNHNFNMLLTDILPMWFVLPLVAFVLLYVLHRIYQYCYARWPVMKEKKLSKRTMKILVLTSACYVAFSIGSNNVANAAGPIAGMVINELGIDVNDESSFLLVAILATLMVAPFFAIGSSLFGHKLVIANGKEITKFGYGGAVAISVVTATLLLVASVTKGIPTSLVQLNTFAIMAYSVARNGWKSTFVNEQIRKVGFVWLIAPLFAFALSLGLIALADRYGIIEMY